MAGIRVTYSRLMSATALSGGVRVTRAAMVLGVANPGAMFISHASLLGVLAQPSELFVTHVSLLKVQSIHRAFYPEFLDSDSVIYSIGGENELAGDITYVLTAGPIPEFNPYKPQIPEEILSIGNQGEGRELYDYLEENQKTLRIQHNLTQAGDTTFPWQMFQVPHDEKIHTLGSITRFYHEQFGIILGRYVQFDSMNQDIRPASPVGLIQDSETRDWIVTNRLEQSHPLLAIGIQAGFIMPKDGQYGWAIIDGIALQEIDNSSTDWEFGESFAWSETGKLGNNAAGIILARRLNEPENKRLLPGETLIKVESLSPAAILESFGDLTNAIAQLQADVDALQALSQAGALITTLQKQVAALTQRLQLEETQRKAADGAINQRIDALDSIDQAALTAALNAINNTITTIQGLLETKIAEAKAIALDALAKANQALSQNLTEIQNQITTILTWIGAESARAKGKFPVVDGAVPPNLVHMEDGSLVYLETF